MIIRKVARSVLVISETSKTSSNFSTHLMDLKVNFILSNIIRVECLDTVFILCVHGSFEII